MKRPELRITQKKYTGASTVISARFPKDLVQDIDEVAAQTGRTRNEILQLCMEFALQHMKIENCGVEITSDELK